MIAYADAGKLMPGVGEYLDRTLTEFTKSLREILGFDVHSGKSLRRVVERIGGKWDCSERPNGQYDTINLYSMLGPLIVFERPFFDASTHSYRGHRVGIVGMDSISEEGVKNHLALVHMLERRETINSLFNHIRNTGQKIPEDLAKLLE